MHAPHTRSEPLEPRFLFATIQADPTFGGDGDFNIPYIGAHDDDVRALTFQTDGKVVIAGVTRPTQTSHPRLLLGRFNANGAPDRTFGRGGQDGHGFVTLDLGPGLIVNDVAVEPKGKILVAGQFQRHMALFRFNKTGTLDKSFADNGTTIVRTAPASDELSHSEASHVLLTGNGRILLAGTAYFQGGSNDDRVFDFAFARLLRDGSLDASFGAGGFEGDGIATTDVDRYDDLHDIALDSQGRIVVAGDTNSETSGIGYVRLRHNPDGSLDTSFSDDGILTHGGPARGGSPGTPQGSPDSSLNALSILSGDRI